MGRNTPIPTSRLYMLGAINGALYSGALLWLTWCYNEYLVGHSIDEAERLGVDPVQLTMNTPNAPAIVFIFVGLFMVGSHFVFHHWGKLRRSAILFWAGVGLTTITGWNVLMLSLLWLEKQVTGQAISYERASSLTDPMFGPMSIALVIVVNLSYAMVIKFGGGALSSFRDRKK